ncbi:hypothetical protein [Thiomonas sp. FB-6]|uniref:hypothetical protein n=1 Tax=Thiomonas sp. FB-6 TaxID=1158291 RepID=UPI0018C8FB7A|nr:hypothetical protein [Thiomonas sp. FB-6]
MASYVRRHAFMGAMAMFALLVVCVVRHVHLRYYVLLAAVGALQAVVVWGLNRRLGRQGESLGQTAIGHPDDSRPMVQKGQRRGGRGR